VPTRVLLCWGFHRSTLQFLLNVYPAIPHYLTGIGNFIAYCSCPDRSSDCVLRAQERARITPFASSTLDLELVSYRASPTTIAERRRALYAVAWDNTQPSRAFHRKSYVKDVQSMQRSLFDNILTSQNTSWPRLLKHLPLGPIPFT